MEAGRTAAPVAIFVREVTRSGATIPMRLAGFLCSVTVPLTLAPSGSWSTEFENQRSKEEVVRPSTPAPPRAEPRIVALLQGNRIAIYDAADGALLANRSLGDTAKWSDGHSLGLSRLGTSAYAALLSRSTKATAIVRLDLADYSVHQSAVIAEAIHYPWLAVGQRSGRLFLAADAGFRIAAIDTTTGARAVTYGSSRDPAMFQTVKWFALSPDESRLFVSYHGSAPRPAKCWS